MSQLSYSLANPIAVEGALYDGAVARDKVSALVELAAGINPGRCLIKGTDDDQVVLPTVATDITDGLITGVSFLDLSLETPVGTPQAALYAQGDSIPSAKKIRLWVVAEDAVTKNGNVFVRFQNGDGIATFDGGFAGATTVDHALSNHMQWFSSAGAGELAVLEINLP